MKRVIILGVSGSIGLQTVEVIKQYSKDFKIVAVSVGTNVEVLKSLVGQFGSIEAAYSIEPTKLNVPNFSGRTGIIDLLRCVEADIVVNALVGSIGFRPSIEALSLGRVLCLANKETLVMGGSLVNEILQKTGGKIIPVDSEHSGIYNIIKDNKEKTLKRVFITASGGSLRDYKRKQLKRVTIKDVLSHPTWSMGDKITVDSATMMNKVFEIIEAHYLFDLSVKQITPLLHRQSYIHAMVEFTDKTLVKDESFPDMKRPIACALLDKTLPVQTDEQPPKITIKTLSYMRYPLLKLAKQVINGSRVLGVVLNVSNDLAVEAFLKGRIGFIEIENIITKTFKYYKRNLSANMVQLSLDNIDSIVSQTKDYINTTFKIGG